MAPSGPAPWLTPPGSLLEPLEEASDLSASLEACTDDEAELDRLEALAAELFPDEDGAGAPAPPRKLPHTAPRARPTVQQLPPPPGLAPPGPGARPPGPRGAQACGGPQGAAAAGRGRPGAAAAPRSQHAGVVAGGAADSSAALDIASVAEEAIQILDQMDGIMTAEAMLDAVSEQLPRLTADAAAEALHRVARRLPSALPAARSPALGPRLRPLLLRLSAGLAELQSARPLAQLAWTLGKLDMRSHAKSPPLLPGMAECIFHICGLLPNVISECSPQDITNTLWGIARLFPGGASGAQGHVHRVSVLSHAIIRQCAQRVAVLTSQSMANSFWAMARLEARGPDVERYVGLALDRLRAPAQLEPFTPQGLANVLWALARRRTAGAGGGPQGSGLQPTLLAVAEAAAGRLLEFQAQELSMVAWSYGKLYEFRKEEAGPARGGRASPRPAPVNDLLRKLAAVAAERIDRFEDQGVSNIAWALATLGLTGAAPQAFLEAAMVHCTAELGGYSAQAVANLLWACVRMDNFSPGGSARSTIERFCSAVAEEMMRRMTTHPNHLRRDKHGSDTTAAEWVAKGLLTSQQMFNIARSAARLHVPREHMQKLVDAIEACIMIRGLRLNDIDKRQWEEVQQWCPSGEASNAGMLYDTWDQHAAHHPWKNKSPKLSLFEHCAANWASGGGCSTWNADQPFAQGA